MDMYTATYFLTMKSRCEIRKCYFKEIEPLDLQTTTLSIAYLNSDTVLQYLDISRDEEEDLLFEEEAYLEFLNTCLIDFHKIFENYLFKKLKNNSEKYSDKHIDFFDRLQKIEPDKNTELILYKYLLVQVHTELHVDEERSIVLFEQISNILYTKKYNNPELSALLFQAVSCDSHLPSYVLCGTSSARKLDYVLRHMKKYYAEKKCPDAFLDYKSRNSIIPCVVSGRNDLLKVLVKYGSWKIFSSRDIYLWMYRCFGAIFSPDSPDMEDILRHYRYGWKQFLLILLFYNSFLIPIQDINQYLSNLRLLWRSIPYPFLNSDEICKILTVFTPPEQHEQLRFLCQVYDDICCSIKLEPRCLKHYARCAIRSILDKKALLPEGICYLDLPEICRSYLRLEC